MKELNWAIFDVEFNGKQQEAFERMSYALFCSMFNRDFGIFAHYNQRGIETEPTQINDMLIGFQAKFLEGTTSFSKAKKRFINSLEKAKENNPELNEIYFYVNKTFGESSLKGEKKPKYILEIENKAIELGMFINWQVPSQIQKQLSLPVNRTIAQEFFPDYHESRKKHLLVQKNDLINYTKTAIIQLEIENIKEAYYENVWKEREVELRKLYKYSDHTNETIATSIFNFLRMIVSEARADMPSSIAHELFSLVITFHPSSFEKEHEERKENGQICIELGFDLAYDALIYRNNRRIAGFGLLIWKYVYRLSKRKKECDLSETVLKKYRELELTLNRPERNDLGYAKELVTIFKSDLDTYQISFPVLPNHLHSNLEG